MSPEEYYKIFGEWPHGYPSARPSYPSKFTELLATNPVTKFLVPGAERFLQRGQNPSFMDVIFAGLGVTPVGRLIPGQIRSALSKGTPVYHGTTSRFTNPNPMNTKQNWSPAYGEGFNVTQSPKIADLYGRTLARKYLGNNTWLPIKPYYVNEYRIPKDSKFLNLDKKLKDQPKDVRNHIITKMLPDQPVGSTNKSILKEYGDWSTGDIYFIKFGKSDMAIPPNYSGVKYSDEMFGFDKGGWKDEFGEVVSGIPAHPFPSRMYKSGETNYVVRPTTSKDRASMSYPEIKPVRKKMKLEFDRGMDSGTPWLKNIWGN